MLTNKQGQIVHINPKRELSTMEKLMYQEHKVLEPRSHVGYPGFSIQERAKLKS